LLQCPAITTKLFRNKILKILLITITSLALLVIVAFFILGFMSQYDEPNGLVEGRLTQCPNTPNCVCSEVEADAVHYIEPLVISVGDAAQIPVRLKAIIREMGGRIHAENADYLAATFTSSIFRFVDDLEIRVDTGQKLIHLRSASRVGHGDRGVNRKRAERLKNLFQLKTG
jgi:uncharacterized protein (DUF1499 family)